MAGRGCQYTSGMWNPANIADKLADVFDPPHDPRFVLVWLHSSAEEAPSDALTAELRRHNLACVAPMGSQSWWVDRVCPAFDPELTAERHLLDDVLPCLGALAHTNPLSCLQTERSVFIVGRWKWGVKGWVGRGMGALGESRDYLALGGRYCPGESGAIVIGEGEI